LNEWATRAQTAARSSRADLVRLPGHELPPFLDPSKCRRGIALAPGGVAQVRPDDELVLRRPAPFERSEKRMTTSTFSIIEWVSSRTRTSPSEAGVTVATKAMTKLWHDDVRRPPDDSWLWARTNEEAMAILRTGGVTEISLDYDLGLEDVDPDSEGAYRRVGSSPNGTGLDLARWMCDHDSVPAKVSVHSWNAAGAEALVGVFEERGFRATRSPYRHRYG